MERTKYLAEITGRRHTGTVCLILFIICYAVLMLLGLVRAAGADEAIRPHGSRIWCLQHAALCEATAPSIVTETETLVRVNDDVNRSIISARGKTEVEMSDAVWRVFPSIGVCHDYAVTKESELVRAGIPLGAMALAYLTVGGEGHMVLLVRTPDGSMVLDSLSDIIWSVDDLSNYHWISRQQFGAPANWESMSSGK